MTSSGNSQPNRRIKKNQVSQWEDVLRKFTESRKEPCKTEPLQIERNPRTMKYFTTDSKYNGTWDVLGMSGQGQYTFPNGVVYKGDLEEGMFHGQGELIYKADDRVVSIIRGKWDKGVMVERTLFFSENLKYNEDNWQYCMQPDRRFAKEYDTGVMPAGMSYMTAEQPTKTIPPGHYDTGDGFYEPKSKVIYKYENPTELVRSPSVREQKWILDNCRMSPETPLGPRPDLYEEWSEPILQPSPTNSYRNEPVDEDFEFAPSPIQC